MYLIFLVQIQCGLFFQKTWPYSNLHTLLFWKSYTNFILTGKWWFEDTVSCTPTSLIHTYLRQEHSSRFQATFGRCFFRRIEKYNVNYGFIFFIFTSRNFNTQKIIWNSKNFEYILEEMVQNLLRLSDEVFSFLKAPLFQRIDRIYKKCRNFQFQK